MNATQTYLPFSLPPVRVKVQPSKADRMLDRCMHPKHRSSQTPRGAVQKQVVYVR